MPAEQRHKSSKPKPRRSPDGRTKNKPATGVRAISKTYLRLLERFFLRTLRSDEELAQAMAVADELAAREEELGPEERHYFDVLCTLMEKYEDETVEVPDVAGADMVRFLIEQRDVTQQTVAAETGIANSTLSAVLNGTRGLNLAHIEKLAAYFGVDRAVFLPAASD